MAKVFISFLGIGNLNAKQGEPGYDELTYRFEENAREYKTMFAQRAIIEKHGASSFDRICLMMTSDSKEKHRDLLLAELVAIGCNAQQFVEDDSITPNQNAEQQWEWFDSLQKLIQKDDEVVFDFTHGFRSVPIIFSTAISFLQKVKSFTLLNAYYGYIISKPDKKGEIIDMAKFYRINQWADGVSRLIDTADASKLAELAEEGKKDGFATLSDPELVKALYTLTDLIRNIDVKNIAEQADKALGLIQLKKQQCSGADAQLLNMVVDKFKDLAITINKPYNLKYFQLQLLLIETLLKHELYMQAFTVMRECLGSLVYSEASGFLQEPRNRNRPKARYELSDSFLEALRKTPKNMRSKNNTFSIYVEPFYNRLVNLNSNLLPKLNNLEKELGEIRNGFSHAWVSKDRVPLDLDEKGKKFLHELRDIITLLQLQGILR